MNLPGMNRRQLHLVDHGLQKLLLLGLVLMETVAAALAIWFLYRALAAAVDENMYRIHFQGSVNVLSLLVREGVPVLGAMLAANLTALVLADRIWVFYVHGILRHLRAQMAAARRLDFSEQAASRFEHAVLEQARRWRGAEAARLARVRERIGTLPECLPESDEGRAVLAAALAALRHE